jgi:hypothetical protein
MGATRYKNQGTKFLIFTQPPFIDAFKEPEEIWISRSPDLVMPGPADDKMYAVLPYYKTPYLVELTPPFQGAAYPPLPKQGQHYDDVGQDNPQFAAVHMYGVIRFALDQWMEYLKKFSNIAQDFKWHFVEPDNDGQSLKRLELIPGIDWNNAQFGYGFIEAGYGIDPKTKEQLPYWRNFDVLCHELGHAVLYATLGIPLLQTITAEYKGFSEAFADLSAILCGLHSNKFVDHVFDQTSGNLYVSNELARIGELSKSSELRIAMNFLKMSDVVKPDTSVNDLTQEQLHTLSQPLTGAFFDTLVQFYQEKLLADGLIDKRLAGRASRSTEFKFANLSKKMTDEELGKYNDEMVASFKEVFEKNPQGFKDALGWARDLLGSALARTITIDAGDETFGPHYLTYKGVSLRFRKSVESMTDGAERDMCLRSIDEAFMWRELPG